MLKIFCKHDWKLISEITTKSAFELATENLATMAHVKLPWQLCNADRKVIQLVTCPKCGAIKKFTETI